MAKVVSIINLKGGVGKTTLTVAMAEFIAVNSPEKRVFGGIGGIEELGIGDSHRLL